LFASLFTPHSPLGGSYLIRTGKGKQYSAVGSSVRKAAMHASIRCGVREMLCLTIRECDEGPVLP